MPIYDYVCEACGHRLEVMHGVDAPGPATCPACGASPMRKAIAAPAVVFKGSGWAKKDRRSAGRKSEKTETGAETSDGARTSAGPGDGGSGDAGSATATARKDSSASPSTPAPAGD
jgi:putative FmdB family regulatory protein